MIQATAPEPLKFMVGGKALTADQLAASSKKRTRLTPQTPDSFHKGFRVEGHPPGAMEEAKRVCDAYYTHFTREREAGRNPGKAPKQWDESYWRNNQKKRPVRAKPYEVPEAAQVCADLAKKAGWLDVAVVEIKREKV